MVSLLVLGSGLQIAASEAASGFSEVFPNADCFTESTRIPGVDGAFAVVATDNMGNVYVAYQSLWGESDNGSYLHIYFAYSHDYGRNWSESFRIDDDGRSFAQCDSPSIAVDKRTGYVFVAWKDNRTGVAKVYIDRSVDRGVSFGQDIVVCAWNYDREETWLPFTVNIKIDDFGRIHVAWISYYSGNQVGEFARCDILFSQSVSDDLVFSVPIAVSPQESESGARLTHPWIAIGGDVVVVAYVSRNSTASGVYLARSSTGGQSFETPTRVCDDSTAAYRGGAQVVISSDQRIHVVWTDGRAGDGTQYLDVYYAFSSDGGLSFSPNVRVNDDLVIISPSVHPHFTRGAQGTPSIVADSEKRVHIVWEDFRNFVDETTHCRDTYYASSEDGVRFSMNIRINYVHSYAESVNNADPNMVVDSQDNLLTVYSDAPSGDNAHPQIYFTFASSPAWKRTKCLISIFPPICLFLALFSFCLALAISVRKSPH